MKKQISHMLRRPLSIIWLARNATKQYLLLVTLLFAFAFSAQAQYETVVTTINGCYGEGSYDYDSDQNGKPKYVNVDNSDFSIFWDGIKWIIDDFGTSIYENTEDTPTPPCDGWTETNGGGCSMLTFSSGCTPPTYETVVTTTNGCSEDGSYEFTALENGKPKYVHTTESNYSIFWDGTKWVLDYSGFTVYENAADTPLPPCGEWDNPYCTFGLVSGCTTPPPTYETVVTTSNGCSGDGTYEFSTIENGKPRYNHTSPFYTIRWYDNKWIIADSNYPQFPAFENAEDTPIPPCDGWVNLYGCPWEFSLVSGCEVVPCTPSISIAADPGNSITAGTSVTFTATPTNGGSTPSYQWKVNGGNVGMNQATFTSATLADGDEVTCEMTSSETCADPTMATSNAVTMEVVDPCDGVTDRLYVTPTGTGNGSSWANAMGDLQAAIDNTCGVTEIWMAAGTYKPADYPTGCTTCTSPRDYAFMLKDGIKIYGGFAGTETALAERVPGNETILSGDVDNNDTWDGGNAYHLLISVTDSDILLDGLTVKHAYGAVNHEFHTLEGERIYKRQAALYMVAATAFTINDVDFVENFGNLYGAGIYIEETGGVNAITNCQFTNNVSGSYAGGIYLEYSGENGGHTNIDSCQFTNNQSSNYAGAIYALSYSNDTISNCQFTGNTSDDGGALYLNYQGSGTATTIVGCTFDDNEADSEGGAVYLYQPEGNYVLDSCQFNGNYAGSKGGAITMYYSGYDYDNFTSINNCEFTENYAYEYGGAIYSEESYGNDVISNCTFTRDSSDYVGGAICLFYSGYNEINYTTITGCEFTENYAYEYGGAIYTEESYGNDTISNCQFMDNKSDYYGGAVYFYYPSENGDNYPTVMDCMFTGNVSAEEGGAVLSYLGDGTQIIRSTFLENEAPIGGGVYLYDYSTYITDCLFAKNTATTDVGGGLYTYSDDLELINCTFADNVATAQPGAGIANEGTMNMVNTILWGNVQQGSGTAGQQQLFNDGGTVNMSYSLIQDGMPDGVTDDGNNLHVDPLFNDPANDDYTLSGCSPAIDAGDNSVAATTDLTGNTRIQGSTVDMGAYEKTPSVGAIDCITFIGFTTCNGVLTYTNADDYATGSVKVDFSTIPASGTLDLSSTALIGTASVDVASLSGNSYTFTGVKILATGQEVEITASFSDNSGSASEMLTTPFPCSRYVFTGTGNWDVPANWQDNNQPANSGNNRHITYLGDAVIYPGMSFGSFGDSVVVAMGGSLDIQQSVTFSKSDGSVNGTGGFENNGTVTLTGNGTVTFPNMDMYNNGDFTINGGSNGLSMSGAANLFNTGTITNHKKIQAYSNITNYTTGVIDNQADINFSSGVFTNEGEFTHNWPGNSLYWNMGVNNSGTFNVVAGTITFSQNNNPYFTNTGTVTNGGTSIFEGSPIVTNETSGTFSNTGIMTLRKGMAQNGAFLNDVGGTLNLENGNVGLENNGTLTNEGIIEQKHAAFVRNNNLMYQNATMNCSAFSFFENNDSLLVPAGATINITSSGMAFTNAATGMFILDGTMTANNQNSSVFVNKGILKGTGILDNSGGRTFDNDAMGSIQPGNISLGDKPNTPIGGEKSGASSDLSIGTLTIHRLNNVGSIDIEIGGNTADIEYDVLDLPANSTIGGTLNVTLVDGFEPACADVFDIITHTSVTGTFATLNLPDGFSVEYLADKVTLNFGKMGISIANVSDADCGGTTCTTDDVFTADVTVTYGAVPASGTLTLTGTNIIGTVASINVGDLAANSHTFTGVTMAADGGDIDLTANDGKPDSGDKDNPEIRKKRADIKDKLERMDKRQALVKEGLSKGKEIFNNLKVDEAKLEIIYQKLLEEDPDSQQLIQDIKKLNKKLALACQKIEKASDLIGDAEAFILNVTDKVSYLIGNQIDAEMPFNEGVMNVLSDFRRDAYDRIYYFQYLFMKAYEAAFLKPFSKSFASQNFMDGLNKTLQQYKHNSTDFFDNIKKIKDAVKALVLTHSNFDYDDYKTAFTEATIGRKQNTTLRFGELREGKENLYLATMNSSIAKAGKDKEVKSISLSFPISYFRDESLLSDYTETKLCEIKLHELAFKFVDEQGNPVLDSKKNLLIDTRSSETSGKTFLSAGGESFSIESASCVFTLQAPRRGVVRTDKYNGYVFYTENDWVWSWEYDFVDGVKPSDKQLSIGQSTAGAIINDLDKKASQIDKDKILSPIPFEGEYRLTLGCPILNLTVHSNDNKLIKVRPQIHTLSFELAFYAKANYDQGRKKSAG
jgi:predicted outer membrane repeat protein